mmetsp:Transcript_10836/g.29393  ORF Transcript_10836/g.29393 Transcript_10836/m.29393 type:complete len:260 (-) Transcript_10836:195-974(-)
MQRSARTSAVLALRTHWRMDWITKSSQSRAASKAAHFISRRGTMSGSSTSVRLCAWTLKTWASAATAARPHSTSVTHCVCSTGARTRKQLSRRPSPWRTGRRLDSGTSSWRAGRDSTPSARSGCLLASGPTTLPWRLSTQTTPWMSSRRSTWQGESRMRRPSLTRVTRSSTPFKFSGTAWMHDAWVQTRPSRPKTTRSAGEATRSMCPSPSEARERDLSLQDMPDLFPDDWERLNGGLKIRQCRLDTADAEVGRPRGWR